MIDLNCNLMNSDSLKFEWSRVPYLYSGNFNMFSFGNDSMANMGMSEGRMELPEDSTVKVTEISEQLENITNYGIGFDDVAALIAIPLIIALFAFSFPFIFTEVNRINDKYDSKEIADLLRKSAVYKSYFLVNRVSIIVLFVYGLISLILKDVLRNWLLDCGNWILLIVAGIYSFVIFRFVHACLAFNKPGKVINFAETAFKKRERAITLKYGVSNVWVSIISLFKSKTVRKRRKKKVELIRHFMLDNNVRLYINGLKSLGMYALKSGDLSLFFSAVSEGVDKVVKLEKDQEQSHTYVFLLLQPIFEYYARLKPSLDVEDSLIFSLFRFHNKSQLIPILDIVNTLRCTTILAKENCVKALSGYINNSKYGYSFVHRFSQTAYVGGLAGDYLIHRQKMLENWDMICNFHFMMAAYWFAKGNYEIFDDMLSGRVRNQPIYPHLRWHILLRYIRCRRHVNVESGEGEFYHFDIKKVFKEPVNTVKMIDNFTVAFLLIATDNDIRLSDIEGVDIKELIEVSNTLKANVNGIKNNKKLVEMYPYILPADFNRIFDDSIGILNRIKDGKINSVDEPASGTCVLGNWFRRIMGCKAAPTITTHSIFDKKVSAKAKLLLEDYIIQKNGLDELTQYYNTGESKSKQIHGIGPLSSSIPITFFSVKGTIPNPYYVSRDVWDIISCRMIYLTLKLFRKGKNNDIVTTYEYFESSVNKVVKDHPENYIFIDCESPVRYLMLGEKDSSLMIKKNNWLKINDIRYRTLEGLEDYEHYKESIIIVSKEDMPSIMHLDKTTSVTISELPPRSGKSYEMILTIDSHLKLAFSDQIKIWVVRLRKS